MSDAGAPENPAPEETSTPADARTTDDAQSEPAGATTDAPAGEAGDIPDAKPAEVPAASDGEIQASDAGAAQPDKATPEDTPAPREPDEVRDPIVEELTKALADDVLASEVRKGDMTVRVTNPAWRRTVQWCKDHGFTYFCFLSGIDWLPDPEAATRYEGTYGATDDDADTAAATAGAGAGTIETGVTGGDTRFQVLCRLYDVDRKIGITLKADLDDTTPSVESVTSVFRGAEWHERETWEMFGFDFAGHPGLRHLYLPTEFEGFPLRKDFPLLARAVKPWPGLVDKEPIPGEGDDEEAEASA
jgi:NADH-quinone oxidoreductase subunit C